MLLAEGLKEEEMSFDKNATYIVDNSFFTLRWEHGFMSLVHFCVDHNHRSHKSARDLLKGIKEVVVGKLIIHSKKEYLNKCIELNPTDAKAYSNRGVVYAELKNDIDRENLYSLVNILNGFGQIAFADIIDIFDFDEVKNRIILIGGAKKLSELPRSITGCIQSLKQTKDGIEVKLYSKDNALAQIAKMKGHYAPTKIIQADTTLEDLLKKE